MIMHIKGIAAAAYSGRTKSSARIPKLLNHLLIASRQQLSDTLHLFTGIECLLFIISELYYGLDARCNTAKSQFSASRWRLVWNQSLPTKFFRN